MSSNVALTAGKSNLVLSKAGVTAPVVRGLQKLTADFLKRIFPADTYKTVARFFGVEPKTAENRLTGARGFNEDEVIAIICSQFGGQYVKDLMDSLPPEERPDWYVISEPIIELVGVKKAALVLRSKAAKTVRKIVDVEEDLSAAIHRAETYSVRDPEFGGAHLDALRSFRRLQTGSVVETKRGKRK